MILFVTVNLLHFHMLPTSHEKEPHGVSKLVVAVSRTQRQDAPKRLIDSPSTAANKTKSHPKVKVDYMEATVVENPSRNESESKKQAVVEQHHKQEKILESDKELVKSNNDADDTVSNVENEHEMALDKGEEASSNKKKEEKTEHPEPDMVVVNLPDHIAPKQSEFVVSNITLLWKSTAQQVVKKDKHGKPLHHNIHAVHAADLQGMGVGGKSDSNLTVEEASVGREPLLAILRDAGVTEMDAASISSLPLWQQVLDLYGEGPVVYGLDTCQAFRENIPVEDASIGTAGLFNTGTNPFAMYLSANCMMPNNTHDKFRGMRWQVPWGKHMLASRKWTNTPRHDQKTNKTNVLPVALIRDPYSWMQSMCRHPYAARWLHNEHHCPILIPTDHDLLHHEDEIHNASAVPVTVGYPVKPAEFPSVAHFWSQWYNEYKEANYPRLIVRFEDLIFHPQELLSTVCACAGAVPKPDEDGITAFRYVVGEGKWGSSVHKGSSNLISAMIRYGTDSGRLHSLTMDDLNYAHEHLDPELLRIFQYASPMAGSKSSSE